MFNNPKNLDDPLDFDDNLNNNNNQMELSFHSNASNNNDNYQYIDENPFNSRDESVDLANIIETIFRYENPIKSSDSSDTENLYMIPKEKKESPNDVKTRTTADKTKTQLCPFVKIKKKRKIFNIKKVKKQLGRKKKNDVKKYGEVHTKDGLDNIIMKIKRALYNHSLKYVNKILKKSNNPKLNSLIFLKVKNSVIDVHKKEENLYLLEMDLIKLFSNEISIKYSKEKPDHNIKTIAKILKVNDKEMNAVLKTLFEEILNVYTGKVKKKLFIDFPTIDDDIEVFRQKGYNKNYIEKYKYVAEHFKEKIEKIHKRRKRSKQ